MDELRTPLTTFQMYSEMLADGLVTTEDQRRQYLLTLKDESQRLSAMVANVLTHARLEERGGSRRFESMNLNVLLTRLKPPLERRVESTLAYPRRGVRAPQGVFGDSGATVMRSVTTEEGR